jgi:hypothetical protein
MAEESDLYVVVVAGAMNPRIHHLEWYKAVKLLHDEDAPLEASVVITTPVLTRFQTKDFTFICQLDRWEIQTKNSSTSPRMLEIAATLFDVTLPHTPVFAFGYNFNLVRRADTNNVPVMLSRRLVPHFVSEDIADKAPAAEVNVSYTDGKRRIQRVIAGVENDPSMIAINANYHYAIEGMGPAKSFLLAPLLRDSYDSDRALAIQEAKRIVTCFGDKMGA